ncbi:MAG: serine acetyltransferase [Chitinophagaceae bacterium]
MFRKYSKSDLYRYAGKTDYRTFLKVWYSTPEYRTIYWFRLAQAYNGKPLLGFMARYFLKKCRYKFHINIDPTTRIGEGFFIGHYSNININDRAVIGKNCNIAQGVTIGQTNRGKMKGAPVIGNNVWIGPNAVIVGAITIGDDVMIAPNALVNMDVPDHSLVIGNPAVIKYKDNATEGYVNKTV